MKTTYTLQIQVIGHDGTGHKQAARVVLDHFGNVVEAVPTMARTAAAQLADGVQSGTVTGPIADMGFEVVEVATETTAAEMKRLFDEQRGPWSYVTTALEAAEATINAAAVAGVKIKRVNITIGDPVVDFEDGSLIVFSAVSWLERGLTAQTQDGRA